MTRRKRVIRSVLLSLCLTVVLFLIGVWTAGGILSAPVPETVGALPEGLMGEDVRFSSPSGATLKGWFLHGRPGRGAVVLLHGVRGDRRHMTGHARFLAKAGYSVLLFDFQAHGESAGEQITFGYRESKDAQAAVQYLRSRAPGEKIGVIGVSMGGAAALLADPPLKVDAMVLEMVYPSIEEAITDRLAMRLGSSVGAMFTPLLSVQMQPRLGITPDRLRPIDQVAEITAPKLFIAGSEDQHTPLAESRRLFAAARAPKEMWVVDGAAHTNLYKFAGEEYRHRVLAFLEKNLARSR
jgi:uncharacterized protein